LGQYDCGQEEEITAVHTLLVPFDEGTLPCFAVGSCRYKAGETEPTEGQLLVFWVHSDGSSAKLAPATSTPLNGCTYAFADINGMIAVAVGSSVCPLLARSIRCLWHLKVVVFRVVVTSDVSNTPSFALHRVLGDAISSVTFLKLDGTRLETLAKDYGSLWPVCLQRWNDTSIIGANVSRM
jgi:DNA damage-binding protein 1